MRAARPTHAKDVVQRNIGSPDSPDALICAVLRGEGAAWPEKSAPEFVTAFLERARYHGVEALLHERLVRMQGWPAIVREALHSGALAAGMWEMRDQAVLRSVLEVFAKIGVRPIIFKGAALAYSFYPSPVLRTRADADLLILPRDRVKVANAIGSLGFVGGQGVPGDIISYQRDYTLNVAGGGVHSIDLHWKISNLAIVVTIVFVRRTSESIYALVAALSRRALRWRRRRSAACVHASRHTQADPYYVDGLPYYGGDRLIWLYDIDLLAQSLTSEQWKSLCSRGDGKRTVRDDARRAPTRRTLLPRALSRRGAERPFEDRRTGGDLSRRRRHRARHGSISWQSAGPPIVFVSSANSSFHRPPTWAPSIRKRGRRGCRGSTRVVRSAVCGIAFDMIAGRNDAERFVARRSPSLAPIGPAIEVT